MSNVVNTQIISQDKLILDKLMHFYTGSSNLTRMLSIIKGQSTISLRIVDWFVTNYSKQYYTMIPFINKHGVSERFKVYLAYKQKLKAYSKKRFDPFCRWDRITVPYGNPEENTFIETTIGQLNFFKWALQYGVIDYIDQNYDIIEKDMISRNSLSKKNEYIEEPGKTRKKREELSISAIKTIKKEDVEIVITFK
jgi:hypothetical protein